jgi:hypothetical protein
MRFILEITDNEADRIVGQVLKEGSLKREYPNKPWTERERKEFVRHHIKRKIGVS